MALFMDKDIERFLRGEAVPGLPHDIQHRARMRLQRVATAGALTDLRVPPSHRLEMLKGGRAGQYSIRINDQWRVCFQWTDQGAMEIEIVDYHLPHGRSDARGRSVTAMAMGPIHPGEHLEEILEELGISQYRLAKTIRVPPIRINQIVHARRAITTDSALRIGRALGTTPDFWLNLQRMYDLDVARASTDVSAIEPLVPAEV